MRTCENIAHRAPVLKLLTEWNAQTLETRDITPDQASAVVILWEDFPDLDGGVPDRIVLPLSVALTTLGEVCFRLPVGIVSDVRTIGKIKTHRLPLRRSWNIVGSHAPGAVAGLFDAGWAQGDQTAILGATDDRALRILGFRSTDDLKLEGEELVFSAIVDGIGMLIAAENFQRIENAISAIEQECRKAGVVLHRD